MRNIANRTQAETQEEAGGSNNSDAPGPARCTGGNNVTDQNNNGHGTTLASRANESEGVHTIGYLLKVNHSF